MRTTLPNSAQQEEAQRKRFESELVRCEQYFRALTENALDVLTIVGPEGEFKYNSPSVKEVLGYEPRELAGRNAFELVHLDDLLLARQAFKRALEHPEQPVVHELRVRRRDGGWCHVEVIGQSWLSNPDIAGVVLNLHDVTERRQTESRLHLLSAALESTAIAMLITDAKGIVIWVNPAFTRLTGYSTQEVVGQNPRLLKSGQHDPIFYKALWDTILAGQVWHAEIVNRRKDGSAYTEEMTITPVRDPRGQLTHFIAVKQDVTARNALQAQLRQAQKMEAIGHLAGGIAHDFNNLLVVMRGNAEIIAMDPSQLSAESLECLKQITAASERAANLTRQLLAFGRKQVMQPQTINLNHVIENFSKMLKRIIGENIRLQTVLETEATFVHADIGMIEQVVVNLVVNARDAMPRGGNLVLKTERTTLDEGYSSLHQEARKGEFLCLTVSDTGHGIAPENIHRIFEPFFTTKEPGKGTGLGLSIVHGIVKQHQGWLEVSSQVGAGTTLKVFLPALAGPQKQAASQAALAPPRGGREKILLVEDELAVRLLTRRILESCGYTVWEAACGREAFQLWLQHPGEIDLLLTDMIMPDGVTGHELARQLRATQPALKVILMSGYTPDVAGKETTFFHRPGTRFLQKPCSSNQLTTTVRECLDEK
jgi:PAS domain S-box-containing protein